MKLGGRGRSEEGGRGEAERQLGSGGGSWAQVVAVEHGRRGRRHAALAAPISHARPHKMAVCGAAVPSTVRMLPGSCWHVWGVTEWGAGMEGGAGCGSRCEAPPTHAPACCGRHPRPPRRRRPAHLCKLAQLVGKGAGDEGAEEDGDHLAGVGGSESRGTRGEAGVRLASCGPTHHHQGARPPHPPTWKAKKRVVTARSISPSLTMPGRGDAVGQHEQSSQCGAGKEALP